MPHFGIHKGDLPGSPDGHHQHGGRARPPRPSTPWSTSSLITLSRCLTASATICWIFRAFDPMPVFMAATADMVEKRPDVIVAYLKAWLDAAKDFKNDPQEGRRVRFTHSTPARATRCRRTRFRPRSTRVEVNPGFPDLKSYMQQQAEILVKNKTIKSHPGLEQGVASGFHGKSQGRGVMLQILRDGCRVHVIVMAGLVPAIHVLNDASGQRRGCAAEGPCMTRV